MCGCFTPATAETRESGRAAGKKSKKGRRARVPKGKPSSHPIATDEAHVLQPNGHSLQPATSQQGHVAHTGSGDQDDDMFSCRDDFSVTDGSHLSELGSGFFPTSPRPSLRHGHHPDPAQPNQSGSQQLPSEQQGEDDSVYEDSIRGQSDEESEEDGGVKLGCLHMLDSLGRGSAGVPHGQSSRPPGGSSRRASGSVPLAGSSMQPRDMGVSVMDVQSSYEDASSSVFQIRSLDYVKTKIKQPSLPAMYQLVTADVWSLPSKQAHIAQHLQLPPSGSPVMAGDVELPPLLIFNLQLPLYMATLFGPSDGEGISIVFVFRLPEGFDPTAFPNQKALELYKRFLTDQKEEDGSQTRDRLKIIPRIVNVEEWVEKGPLSSAEHKLLTAYNDKPILARPQHTFYEGHNYFEVDLDVHKYNFLARRSITNYLQRLSLVVWENAFVVQGNDPDELPEHLLGTSRMYRFDFMHAKPLTIDPSRCK